MPQSIACIYQIQACRFILVQGIDDTEIPSIPALTRKGFVRFEAIQILLDPGTHVPLIQFAVRNWNLKHPDNGTPFPPDLPTDSFPSEPDPDTDRWHQNCGRRLRDLATPREDPKPNPSEPKEPPKSGFADRKVPIFAHVRVKRPSQEDYFNRPNVPFAHVPEHAVPRGTPLSRSPERERYNNRERDRGPADRLREERYPRRQGSSSDEPPHRRKSFDPGHVPLETRSANIPHRTSERHPAPRRHSQPRHYSSSSETEESPVSPHTRTRRRSHRSNDPPEVRRVYPSGGPRVVSSHPHLSSIPVIPMVSVSEDGRRPSRSDDPKRKSIFDIKGKVMSFFPVGGDPVRQRSGSRGRRDEPGAHGRPSVHKEDSHPLSRMGRSHSDYNSEESDSASPRRKKQSKLDRDRERDRDRTRERDLRDRTRDRGDREREKSSHDNKIRRRDSDERRERERDRDRERERERERTRERDRGMPPPRRSREPSDEDLSPRSRTRGSGGSNSYLAHPEDGYRRTSSHADLDRKREWDARDRDLRARDRIRDRVDRDRERHRDKERERERERGPRDRDQQDGVPLARQPSPPTGVTGRKYVDPWNRAD